MGLDPGYRTGCKMVVINKDGFYETNDVLYLVEEMHNQRQLDEAKKKILNYIDKYDVDIIAIPKPFNTLGNSSAPAYCLKPGLEAL